MRNFLEQRRPCCQAKWYAHPSQCPPCDIHCQIYGSRINNRSDDLSMSAIPFLVFRRVHMLTATIAPVQTASRRPRLFALTSAIQENLDFCIRRFPGFLTDSWNMILTRWQDSIKQRWFLLVYIQLDCQGNLAIAELIEDHSSSFHHLRTSGKILLIGIGRKSNYTR